MSSQPPTEPRAIPHAGRPRGAAWRALQSEGIEWEAQVLIGTDERALSARLIVTEERLAFARGGEVVLDIPRSWIAQAPYLSGNGAINLRIQTTNGHRDKLQFVARDGRTVATDFVNLLTYGPDTLDVPDYEPQYNRVPERRRSALPPDPSFETELVKPLPDDHRYSSSVIDASTMQTLDQMDLPPVTEAASPSTNLRNAPDGGRGSAEPITISTLANQTHRAGEWSLHPIPTMAANSGKISRTGWAFRLSGLVLLLAIAAAAFGTGNLPNLPSRDTFIAAPDNTTPSDQSVAQAITTETVATGFYGAESATVDTAETSIALGVGAETASWTPTHSDPTATRSVVATETDSAMIPAGVDDQSTIAAPESTSHRNAIPDCDRNHRSDGGSVAANRNCHGSRANRDRNSRSDRCCDGHTSRYRHAARG